MITDGFTYVAVLILLAGALVTLEKGTGWTLFRYLPAVVLVYLISMLLCTVGTWDMAATKPAYAGLKNSLTYAMVFTMLLRCDIRKVLKRLFLCVGYHHDRIRRCLSRHEDVYWRRFVDGTRCTLWLVARWLGQHGRCAGGTWCVGGRHGLCACSRLD